MGVVVSLGEAVVVAGILMAAYGLLLLVVDLLRGAVP